GRTARGAVAHAQTGRLAALCDLLGLPFGRRTADRRIFATPRGCGSPFGRPLAGPPAAAAGQWFDGRRRRARRPVRRRAGGLRGRFLLCVAARGRARRAALPLSPCPTPRACRAPVSQTPPCS